MPIRVEIEKCIGCKLCILTCPEPNVISFNSEKKVAIASEKCKACGLCIEVCPKEAIEIIVNPT